MALRVSHPNNTAMSNEELVTYVLERVPVHVFNAATKSFSTQKLYGHVKRSMLVDCPIFKGSTLTFAVKMADAFRPYTVYAIAGEYPTVIAANIDSLRAKVLLFPTMHPMRHKLTEEYNALIDGFNEALKPQNKLIKLYRKIQKAKR